jgi:2-polyprenyl-6-methoxyphenol hydroxylase-like FAD-dependent oxidoreductase
VLLVDRATFPSDTLSTHFVHPPGVAALERWGLRERLAATGCPPVHRYSFDFGPFVIAGSPRPVDDVGVAYCPRRTVLDELLVHAAAAAGAEVREGFSVDEILVEGRRVVGVRGHVGGRSMTERASVVIGADGRNSSVAKAVQPEQYNERPALSPAVYSYWSGVDSVGFEVFVGERCGMAAFPTHDDLTLVVAGFPEADFDAVRHDTAGELARALAKVPALADRMRSAHREERFHTATNLGGYFRTPSGPGWALVGDAGYRLHPITAQGITDAFLDAERMVDALDAVFAERRGFEESMECHRSERDERVLPMYDLTFELAHLEQPPPAEMQQLLAAVACTQEVMDDFVSTQAGTLPIPAFFSPENVGRIMNVSA